MESVVVRRVDTVGLSDIHPLVIESEQEGFRFVRRFYDDYISGANRFNHEGEALFVAKLAGQIVGICGLNRDPYIMDSNVGRVRRLYVHPNARRRAIGKQLVYHVIQEAAHYYKTLTLRTDSANADAFYRALGFSKSQTYADATHVLSFKGEFLMG